MGHWGSEKLSDFSEVPKQSENVTPGLKTKPLPRGFLLLHEVSAHGWIYGNTLFLTDTRQQQILCLPRGSCCCTPIYCTEQAAIWGTATPVLMKSKLACLFHLWTLGYWLNRSGRSKSGLVTSLKLHWFPASHSHWPSEEENRGKRREPRCFVHLSCAGHYTRPFEHIISWNFSPQNLWSNYFHSYFTHVTIKNQQIIFQGYSVIIRV